MDSEVSGLRVGDSSCLMASWMGYEHDDTWVYTERMCHVNRPILLKCATEDLLPTHQCTEGLPHAESQH
eukprot:349867-Amphidinium_carterae.1